MASTKQQRRNQRRRVLGLSSLIVGGGCVIIIAHLISSTSAQPTTSSGNDTHQIDQSQVQMMADDRQIPLHAYRIYVSSLSQLYQSSSAIVIGHVVGKTGQKLIPQPVATPGQITPPSTVSKKATGHPDQTFPANIKAAPQDLPVSTVSVTVSQSLKGNLAAGTQVSVDMAGGSISWTPYPGSPLFHRTLVFDDAPFLKDGEDVLLFLDKSLSGTYIILNGSQGHFSLTQGKLHAVFPQVPVTRDFDGKDLSNLITSLPK